MKDGEIEELTREIQMYYGIKRHIEELTKENQVFGEFMKKGFAYIRLTLRDLKEGGGIGRTWDQVLLV